MSESASAPDADSPQTPRVGVFTTMGWRFRKSFSFVGTRFTLTKRGVGTSWRLPGCTVGINAQGRWYLSFGIPGTGFYWIKHF